MLSKGVRRVVVWGGILILTGALFLVDRFTEFSPWMWAALLAGAGLGAFGLYLTDRSDGLVLLAAYALWAIAGLLALVPSEVLRGEAIACYVLPAIALPFLVAFVRDRARWWALIPAYPLLAIVGVIGLTRLGISDNAASIYVISVWTIPFFVIYARNRKQWWALIPGSITALIGLSFLITRGGVGHSVVLAVLIVGASILVRAFASRGPAGGAALSGSERPTPSGR